MYGRIQATKKESILKYSFETDPNLTFLVSWMAANMGHQVRCTSESDAIDLAVSFTVPAHVYSTVDFRIIFANISSGEYKDL